MNKLVLVFACLVVAKSAYGLKCYSCDSRLIAECADKPSEKNVVVCGQSKLSTYTTACLKQVITDPNDKEITLRKCALYETDTSKTCQEGVTPGSKLNHCSDCKEDLCNAAAPLNIGLATFFSTLFVYLFKYTL